MSTLFPLPAPLAAAPPPTLFALPELPRPAAYTRAPVCAYDITLDRLNDLLHAHGIGLGQAATVPEVWQFIKRREAVFEGTWPLKVYKNLHECDCEHCHCAEITLAWRCPFCGEDLEATDEKLDADFAPECDRHTTTAEHAMGCGAEFTTRKVGGDWRLFAVPDTSQETTFP